MKKSIAIILSIVFILVITLPAAAISTVAVKSIKLDTSNITLDVGQTYNLKVSLTPANTTQRLLTYVTWNQNVATVDKTGKITGVGAGTATILVYTPNKKIFAECKVTISPPVDKNLVGNMYQKGLPIVKNKVTLKVFATKKAVSPDYMKMEFYKKLEAKTNVKIEWEFEDVEQTGQKLALKLASGEYPDLFFNNILPNDIARYGLEGGFKKLDSLIETYGENIKKVFKSRPDIEKMSRATDGNTYSVAFGNENGVAYNSDQMFINKVWLDKLNLKVPTTLDQFYQVLKAFKEKDPNGNGKTDEIPFSFLDNHIYGIASLFAAFGRSDMVVMPSATPEIRNHFTVENGKVVFTADKPEYKDAIVYLQKYFKEGLFDKEGFTQPKAQLVAKGQGSEIILGSFFGWAISSVVGPAREKNYIPLPPMTGPSGKKLWTKNNLTNGQLRPSSFVITNKCKNPEIAFRWIDLFYDQKTSCEANYGSVSGSLLREGSDGNLRFSEIPPSVGLADHVLQFAAYFPPGIILKEYYDNGYIQVFPLDKAKYDIMKETYAPYLKSETLPDLIATPEEATYFQSIGIDIQNYISDNRAKWLINGGIEEEWSGYISRLKQMKLDEYVKKMQGVIDRMK